MQVRIVACGMVTGRLSAYMCPTCDSLSAYVDNPQRGLKRMSIAVSPFDEYDEDSMVNCNVCLTPAVLEILDSRMILYASGHILAVCPLCNFLAAHRDDMITTVCRKCAIRNNTIIQSVEKKQVCYIDSRRITSEIRMQTLLCQATRTIIVKPVCEYHYRERIGLA